ncbi:Rho GTPase-activating protein 29 [Balamuthia mandrillaris]
MFKGHKRRKSIDTTRVGKTVEKEEKASPTTEKEQKKLDKLQKKEQKKLSKQQRNSIPKKGPAAGSLVNAENESNSFKSGSPRSNTAAASMLAMTTAQGLTTAINQSGKPAAVFGVDLEELMKLQESFEPKLQVPLLVKECIHYLVRRGMGSEGIFRISAPLSQLVVLKDDFNRQLTTREKVDLERVDNPDIVSSCLKLFLRELPSPLLTFELGTLFCQAMDEKQGEAEKIQQVSSLIEQLPEVNQNILYACLSLLFMVSCNSHHNMMDADNLSLVVGPNMLWSEQGDVSLGHLAKVNTLIRFMIQNLDELFPLPLSSFRLSTEPEMALLRRKMIGHKKSVQCLCHSANHDFVWSADSLGLVRIYDASSVELVNEVSTNMQNIFCMLGNGDNIWIGCPVSIQIRSEESGALLREMSCFCGSLLEVGEHVWAGGDGQVHVFDSKTFDKVDTIQVPPSVLTFAMVLVGEKVWCAGTDNKIRVYNSKSRVLETDYEAQRRKINHMIKVDNTVWSTSDDKTIVVWHADTHEKLATLDSHSGYVYTLTHFGNRVWSCSWDKHILIWDSKVCFSSWDFTLFFSLFI